MAGVVAMSDRLSIDQVLSLSVGFTGTQAGMTGPQRALLRFLIVRAREFHHGGCVGADAEAHELARAEGRWIKIHPCNIKSKRAHCSGANVVAAIRPPLARNHDIVDETDILIAAPRRMIPELRSGTWATVRYAQKTGRRVTILWPDGRVEHGWAG